MDTTTRASPPLRALRRGLGTLAAVFLAVATAAATAAEGQKKGGGSQGAGQQIQREDPLARAGFTEQFSATLDSAPEAVDWKLFRQSAAVRYEPGKSEELEPGTRKHLTLHVAVIEGGEIQQHHTSDPVELLPGAAKLDPDMLPESSMIPDGYRISSLLALGELTVEPGEIMTKLAKDIIADMTKDKPALYLAATPPKGQVDGPHKIHPVLVQLAPAETQKGGGPGG